MKDGTRMAALLAAFLVGTSVAAVAQSTTETTPSGVTIFRGGIGTRTENPPPAAANDITGPTRGTTQTDRSGTINSLLTGSSSAGGESANPPPGAGR